MVLYGPSFVLLPSNLISAVGCSRKFQNNQGVPAPLRQSIPIFLTLAGCTSVLEGQLTALGEAPDWDKLERYQETITRDEFVRLLEEVYSPDGGYRETIEITADEALIKKGEECEISRYRLRFSGGDKKVIRKDRFWRIRSEIPSHRDKILNGLRVALDPGHIGGRYARMEERWFRVLDQTPVMEGDLNLRVARLLRERLRERGAAVWLLREGSEPVTQETPESLRTVAVEELSHGKLKGEEADGYGNSGVGENIGAKETELRELSELLFYRMSEIRARARLINEIIRPDLVVAIHFNAAPWRDAEKRTLATENHMHILINGAYSSEELAYDDTRFRMVQRLLSNVAEEELPLASTVAKAMARATGLPPFHYEGKNAAAIKGEPYVWARNLIANRLYQCPVLYLEPYVVNNRIVHSRVQAGDFDGEREIEGERYPSIFREYADGVVKGLELYYGAIGPHREKRIEQKETPSMRLRAVK